MPYIPLTDRKPLDLKMAPLLEENLPAGSLAYVLTRIVLNYIFRQGTRVTYAALALAIGVMFLTMLEVVRRVVNPYEDTKAKENGEVFL